MIYCGKGVRIRSFCGQYFSALGLNIEAYSVNLRFSPKTGKHRPEKLRIRTLFTQRFNSKNFSCYYAEHQSSIWILLFSVHYFREKALSQVFSRVLNTPLEVLIWDSWQVYGISNQLFLQQ